jgi:hypothetical protein
MQKEDLFQKDGGGEGGSCTSFAGSEYTIDSLRRAFEASWSKVGQAGCGAGAAGARLGRCDVRTALGNTRALGISLYHTEYTFFGS